MSERVKLGALWAKKPREEVFFTGVVAIDGVTTKITVWKNKLKSKENQPDYIIYKDDWAERRAEARAVAAQAKTDAPSQVTEDAGSEETPKDDVPF